MKKKGSRIKKEAQEREQYLNTDFGEALDKLEPLQLDLDFAPPTQSISLRLPREVLNKIRVLADEQDIPYQSLIKLWLVEKLKKAS
jgi:predicted DNA binding CopG/RHH family protein